MPRPLRKSHRLQLVVTPGELAELRAAAGDAPLGPAVVRLALGWRPVGAGAETRVVRDVSPREHVAALEAWAATLDRYSTSRGALMRLIPDLARLVRDA